jgi:hypothetical protein
MLNFNNWCFLTVCSSLPYITAQILWVKVSHFISLKGKNFNVPFLLQHRSPNTCTYMCTYTFSCFTDVQLSGFVVTMTFMLPFMRYTSTCRMAGRSTLWVCVSRVASLDFSWSSGVLACDIVLRHLPSSLLCGSEETELCYFVIN